MPIVFTRAWEDDRLDAETLAVGPGQRALVVAGAGDTALALAADGASVVAVDANPDQLRLCALKDAARVLPPARLHAWFEAARGAAIPGEYWTVVRPRMSPDDRAWWDGRIRQFERGLHRSVGLGRRFIRVARAGRLIRPDVARRVESFRDPAEQADWWHRRLRPWVFGPVPRWLVARGPVLSALSPNRNETDRVRRGAWFRGLATRVDGVLERVLVREHPWWRPLASGRPADPGHGAAWLDPDRVARRAASNASIEWRWGDLTAALVEQPPASLDAISVSNVPDWLDDGAEVALAAAVGRAAAPGARVLIRHLVRSEAEDPYVAAGLVRDPASDDLPSRDRTALYEAIDLYRMPSLKRASRDRTRRG
jgi:S-adenosylmethionine-diacylglycerol 3-amino-3-carboxypropyl transferase